MLLATLDRLHYTSMQLTIVSSVVWSHIAGVKSSEGNKNLTLWKEQFGLSSATWAHTPACAHSSILPALDKLVTGLARVLTVIWSTCAV